MVHHCCAIGCTNSSDLCRTLKFHRFPLKNLFLLQKWMKAVRRKDFTPTKSTKICSDHFVEDNYCGRNLKPTAVPSIFNFEAANQVKSKKVLAEEEDIVLLDALQIVQPELCTLPGLDTSESELSPEPINEIEWDPVMELGLDSSQVELHFEDGVQSSLDEPPKLLHLSNCSASCKEQGTQTFLNKCNFCQNNRDKFKLFHKQIKRRDNRIIKLQHVIASLKEQITDSKKRKIKIVGNNIILVDTLDNNKSFRNISVNEQYQVALSVS